jgi:hypothetical protein
VHAPRDCPTTTNGSCYTSWRPITLGDCPRPTSSVARRVEQPAVGVPAPPGEHDTGERRTRPERPGWPCPAQRSASASYTPRIRSGAGSRSVVVQAHPRDTRAIISAARTLPWLADGRLRPGRALSIRLAGLGGVWRRTRSTRVYRSPRAPRRLARRRLGQDGRRCARALRLREGTRPGGAERPTVRASASRCDLTGSRYASGAHRD